MRFLKLLAISVPALAAIQMHAQRSPYKTPGNRAVVQGKLTAAGSPPFHLVAEVQTKPDTAPDTRIEIYWAAPDQYSRTVKSPEFNQTLIVDGDRVSEVDSQDYLPLSIDTFIAAMIDPDRILSAIREGDRVSTKANGGANEQGIECLDEVHRLCFKGNDGMREVIGASGHSVAFAEYRPFGTKRIARVITNAPRLGEELQTLTVEVLEKWKPDPSVFEVKQTTSPEERLITTTLSSQDLLRAAVPPQSTHHLATASGRCRERQSQLLRFDRSARRSARGQAALHRKRTDKRQRQETN